MLTRLQYGQQKDSLAQKRQATLKLGEHTSSRAKQEKKPDSWRVSIAGVWHQESESQGG